MTAFEPSSAALLIASVMPRSLNEPVGLSPSTFRCTSQPVNADRRGAGTSGVPPSRSVTTGVAVVTGSRSRNSSMTPRHGEVREIVAVICLQAPFDPHDAGDGTHRVEPTQLVHGCRECSVA